uniref:Carbohydrate-binding-like fold protein n=1 Tax=Daucus carota subsp. sativus TaxID=79200 RepID=A0A164YXW9_DAUCS
MTILHHLLLIACIFISLNPIIPAIADSILGCGGFVEASSALIKSRKATDAKLDYSHITVELRTVDGLMKDRTQCAPNGYYFIPVYDKGSFVIKIKGPQGWSWDPIQVPVVVDHNGCNANEDINFQFTGFTVSGRVVGAVGGESCSHKTGGPSSVTVELLHHPSGAVASSVLTSTDGSYSFSNIIPGNYNVRAAHNDLPIEVKGSTEVELGFGNAVIDDIFYVPGYDIHGLVVAQGNPLLGVHIYLYSDDVLEVNCPQGFGDPPGESKALCHAISDADGVFKFKSIPCGLYKLIPYYKGENTVFDVSPPFLFVSVQHEHATVPQKFQVTGFSVGGRVVDGNNKGVDGVKIIVDGQEKSITDKEGFYKLDQVTSKRYTIEAKKEHYKFDKLHDFMVLPNMALVDDIKAISYDVCGLVETVSPGYKAKVALTHGPENVKPQVKQTDNNGNFCFEVLPGEYRLSSFAAKPESSPELLLLPPYVDVNVNRPLLNVRFHQAQVNVIGSVMCLENCGSSVYVTLVRLGGSSKKERKTVSLTDQSSEFLFPNILPGKYRLEVKRQFPGLSEDNWCWDQNFFDVDVGTEDVNGISFVQKGYWVNVVSTHAVDAYFTQPDGSHVNLKIEKGSQKICVGTPGVHELHFVNSCIFFGSSPVKIDTSNPSPVSLKGEKYLLKGQISIESSSLDGLDTSADTILVDILNSEGLFVEGTSARFVGARNGQSDASIFEYSLWANPGEKLTFVPRDARDNGERKILFYPRQHKVAVSQDGCQAAIPLFLGRLGLYIEGSVSPPLSDVYIRIIAGANKENAPMKPAEVVLETTTGGDGVFVGGPLYDDITYNVEASKPGYHVKAVGPYSFSCQKLSQISVHIYSEENPNELFPSVLLSLSGEDGYRNNSVAGAGGTFLFDNLFPGSFYLRPLLKEYAFSPAAQAIELGSGESQKPKEGVLVEARSESKGYYEETLTDSSGSYRLRGLLPNTVYVIKVGKKGDLDNQIERASPDSVVAEIGVGDIKDLNFLVFEQPHMTIISGHIEGNRIKELREHLRVEIRSANDPSKVESTLPLPLSNFFQVKDLPKGKYLLQLRSVLPPNIHRFKTEVIEVDLEKHTQIHVGPLNYTLVEEHHKQELTPAPVYPLIVGVSLIGLLLGMPRLKDLYQGTIGASLSGSMASAKKEMRRPTIRKKTY